MAESATSNGMGSVDEADAVKHNGIEHVEACSNVSWLPQPAFQPVELPTDFNFSPLDNPVLTAAPNKIAGNQPSHSSDVTPSSPDSSKLMNLPVELRLNIYAQHFGYESMTLAFNSQLDMVERFHYAEQKLRSRGIRNLLCVNRQIHKEAINMLWECTTFIIDIYARPAWSRIGYNRPISTQSDCALFYGEQRPGAFWLERMRHAVIVLRLRPYDHLSAMQTLLRRLGTMGPLLKTLELHFYWEARGTFRAAIVEETYSELWDVKAGIVTKMSSLKPHNGHVSWREYVPDNESKAWKDLVRRLDGYVVYLLNKLTR